MALRTDFPESHSEIFVGVEPSCKFIAVVKSRHEAQKMLGRDRVVNVVILEKLVSRLDEKQLQYAFDNDLLKDPSSSGSRQRAELFRRIAESGQRDYKDRVWSVENTWLVLKDTDLAQQPRRHPRVVSSLLEASRRRVDGRSW